MYKVSKLTILGRFADALVDRAMKDVLYSPMNLKRYSAVLAVAHFRDENPLNPEVFLRASRDDTRV